MAMKLRSIEITTRREGVFYLFCRDHRGEQAGGVESRDAGDATHSATPEAVRAELAALADRIESTVAQVLNHLSPEQLSGIDIRYDAHAQIVRRAHIWYMSAVLGTPMDRPMKEENRQKIEEALK